QLISPNLTCHLPSPYPQCVLGSGASGLPEKRSECPYGDYLSKNGICCQRCPPGYKREKDCEAVGNRTSCTRCPKGQYNEHENYSDNCRSCQTCQCESHHRPFKEVTECTPRQNTKCRCKNGYYKDVIDSSTSQCLECSKCGHGEHQSEKFPGLIYSMLSLVPAHRVKELVRCLGVTDLEIERAEIDYHTCKEAHYQMLRVWAERGSRGGEAGRGGGVLHRPLMQQLLDRLSDMHLGGALEELKSTLLSEPITW
uniref:Tumor necrosis factor receptor superfamily member 6 n=1 Tax=Gadus morhua TaxID=8049 RepID=A0A8C4ZF87_GADMO